MNDPRREPAQPSASSQIWFVRAGVRGADVGSFLAECFIGIAWAETAALNGLLALRAFEEPVAAAYPTCSRSSKATDEGFTKSAVKIRCRPRVTHHGDTTKTAVESH